MAKGHCDVSILDHEKEGRDKEKSEVKLEAKIPYSEIKLKINNKVHLISVFGKRARLFGVPAFLDEALTPYRESLAATAAGTVAIEKALGARAMRDALKLELEGKGKPDELRRLYPVGLSGDVASEIILNMDSALKRITLKSRSIAAGAILFMNILVLAAYLASPAEEFLAKNVSKVLANFLDVVLPFLCMGIGWVGLSHSATWSLQRLYPDVKVKVVSKIGNLGYMSLAAIPAIYAMIYALTR
jgi:hypothetical protein